MNGQARPYVLVFTLATVASVSAFVLHLGLRGRTVSVGYELGRARTEQARLREVKRVLEVESASYKTPERVEIVAHTLLGMQPPLPDRIVNLPPLEERGVSTSKGDAKRENLHANAAPTSP